MFDMFEVLESWKLSCDLSFLLLGVSDGHIFFDFSNYCPPVLTTNIEYVHKGILSLGRKGSKLLSVTWTGPLLQ